MELHPTSEADSALADGALVDGTAASNASEDVGGNEAPTSTSPQSRTLLRKSLFLVVVAALCLTAALWLAELTSCGSESSQPQQAAVENTATLEASDAAEALGQSYTVAYTEMVKEVPDAKLLGAQTTSTVFADGSPQWMYLFGSKDTKEAYTVFMGAPVEGSETPTATVAGYGPFDVSDEEWESIPNLTSDAVLATPGSAWALRAAEAAYGKTIGSYTISLLTYVPADTEGNYEPMQWEVVLFDDAETQQNIDADHAGDGTAEASDVALGTCYVVSATDGTLYQKTLDE